MKIYKIISIHLTTLLMCIVCSLCVSARSSETSAEALISTNVSSTTVTTITDLNSRGEWIQENGKKFYITDGIKSTGLCEIDGKEYYFAANGAVKCGWYTIDGIRMYFSPESYQRQYGWILYNGNKFFLDESGKLTGMHSIDNKDYIFDNQGICQSGWILYNGNKYYSDNENGIYKNECIIEGEKYYFSSKGKFKSGFINSDGIRIFYDYDTAKPVYGFISYNGNIYYVDKQKGKLTDDTIINGVKYRFDNLGCMMTGFQNFEDGTRYYDENGKIISGFADINGYRYYFDKNFIMQTGFTTINGQKYYFDKNGIMLTGMQTIEEKTYYFNKNGIMLTGWQSIDNKKYFFDSTGVMYTGWQNINGKYYLFGDDGSLQPSPKIFVGVGHGGYDPGAIGYIVEKEYTLKTAKAVAEYLKNWGLEFMLSRDDDIDTTMESKLKLCNDYDPDLIIDIHFNAVGNGGFEVYHSQYGGLSLTLAENINKLVSQIMYSQGCKIMLYPDGRDRFTIIRETHAPAVLLEGGFVDIYSDAMFIKDNYKKLAKAYAKGILNTLNTIMKNKFG